MAISQQPPEATQPKQLTPYEIEHKWFETVYQGDNMPQLTVRAVVMGAVLGMVMSLSNLYVGLRTGWGLGVAITACILSFAIWRSLRSVMPGVFKSDMSILENNCMQSTASSAGYSTGGTMVSAISAYLMVTGHHMAWPVLVLWTFFLAILGVFMAVPMKRQMINIEQLKFPSGIAAAETLRSLHNKGTEAVKKARSLGASALLGGFIVWLKDGGMPWWSRASGWTMKHLQGFITLPESWTQGGFPLSRWTVEVEVSLIMIAAGAIIGMKVAWSMMFGSIVNYLILTPYIVNHYPGAIDTTHMGFSAIVRWSTWTGASIMVTSALMAFAFQWKTVIRAFSGLSRIVKGRDAKKEIDPMDRIEVPGSWFVWGFSLSGLACILLLMFAFQTAWYMGIVAVLMTFVLAIVACRATGESDITPVGAMGKITQLMFGAVAPSNMTTNLMTASVTAGAAGSSADLLTDLKSGYILGANPRKQFLAQFFGCFAGVLVVVPAFYILVPTADALGTDRWPAPAAQTWAAVARLLSGGLGALHPTARWGLLIGSLIGIILPLIGKLFPKASKYLPSALGLGLAMVIQFYSALGMFLGAVIASFLAKKKPAVAEMYTIPVASGIIAGESIMGIVTTLLGAAGWLG